MKPVREWVSLGKPYQYPVMPYNDPEFDTRGPACKQHLKCIKDSQGANHVADIFHDIDRSLQSDKVKDYTENTWPQTWSMLETRRLALEQTIKRTLREWPICSVTNKPYEIHWQGATYKTAMWFCEGCDTGPRPKEEPALAIIRDELKTYADLYTRSEQIKMWQDEAYNCTWGKI